MRPSLLLAVLLWGCPSSAPTDAPMGASDVPTATADAPLPDGMLPDGGGEPVPSPDGMGVCCPIGFPTCDCFPNGGFAATASGCGFMRLCDAAPPSMIVTDSHGCPVLTASGSCLARDAGP